MNEITIYEYQLKVVADVLRLTANIYDCRKQVTCFDRQVTQAEQFVNNALTGEKDKKVTYAKKVDKIEYPFLQQLFEKMIANQRVYVSGKALKEFLFNTNIEVPYIPQESFHYSLYIDSVGIDKIDVNFIEPISATRVYFKNFDINKLILEQPEGEKVWLT